MSNPSRKKRTLAITVVGSAIAAAVIMAVLSLMFRDASLTRHRKEGVIRIGYALEAPYAFLTSEGEVTGESPEVARQIAASLGIRNVAWRQSEFATLIPKLEAGLIDVIAAGMFITPERAKRVNFSVPTFQVRQGLLVPKGNPRQLHSYRQAAEIVDIYISVLAGSVEEDMLRRHGLPDRRLIIVPDALTGPAIAAETPRGRGETVLLVEDESALLEMTRKLLQMEGYTVLAASTPEEAVRLAEEHPGVIHLLLTDVVMPGMNGRELTERIQRLRPATKSLFMSGYTADVIAHHGVLDEGVQFIQKPFSKQDLAAKIRAVLATSA